MKKEIKEKITDELIGLNIPLTGNSFVYWTELLMIVYKNGGKKHLRLSSLYEIIAKKYDSTPAAIERVIRYSKNKMEKNLVEKYNITNDKITTTTFINVFILKVF